MKSLSISEKRGWSKYIAHQAYYSLLNRDYEWELMPLGIDQKVGALVWSPLAGGKLSGKYRRNQPIPANARVAQGGSPVVSDPTTEERLYTIVEVLYQLAEETGKTVPQIALNWILQRPTISSLIIGARNEEQLIANFGAIGWNLTLDQVKKLDAASETLPAYPYWHQRQFPMLNAAPQLYRI
jgi:aryl-alcohol dehydrogenase-like predicted oxidoreductase